ncbi:MAG: hypothetical protein ACE5FC_09305 [Myxococcota bacterium]
MTPPRSDRTSQRFRTFVFDFFERNDNCLKRGFTLDIGAAAIKRPHAFDMGCDLHHVLIE